MRFPAVAALLAHVALGGAAPAVAGTACVVESDCIDRSGGIATREGGRLALHLANGETRAFDDDLTGCPEAGETASPGGGDACLRHALVAVSEEAGIAVVERDAGGAVTYDMVDIRDGDGFPLPSQSEASPSGRRVAFASAGRVHVWERSPQRWAELASVGLGDPGEDWSVSGWDGEGRVLARLRGEPAASVVEGPGGWGPSASAR